MFLLVLVVLIRTIGLAVAKMPQRAALRSQGATRPHMLRTQTGGLGARKPKTLR